MIRSLKSLAIATIGVALTALSAGAAHAQLNGAGATFPAPLYQRWFQEYAQQSHVQINYQAIGSGGGIKQITARSVDFGASDAPMSDAEQAAAPGILHVPTVAGAVCVSYNLPGVKQGINLTGPVIADIFLGKIATWNDAQIGKLNPGVRLPALKIFAIHRADGSGTTNAFTTYLSEVSPSWKTEVGAGKSVNWKGGLGGKQNAGVAQQLRQTPGAIGYLELAYAVQNRIEFAAVQNAKGKFVLPSVASTTAAAAGSTLPADFRKVIVNTSAAEGYPITSFTFVLFYPNAKPEVKKFLQWALTTGQNDAATLYYAPLPAAVKTRALQMVGRIK